MGVWDGVLLGATAVLAAESLVVLLCAGAIHLRSRWRLRYRPVDASRAAVPADAARAEVAPAHHVPLLRTPQERLLHFQVVHEAGSVLEERLLVLGPLYLHGEQLMGPGPAR